MLSLSKHTNRVFPQAVEAGRLSWKTQEWANREGVPPAPQDVRSWPAGWRKVPIGAKQRTFTFLLEPAALCCLSIYYCRTVAASILVMGVH